MSRLVALKVIPGAFRGGPRASGTLRAGAQAIAALNHPGIVTVCSVRQADSRWFLTMELVEGRPLSDFIATH